MKRSKRGDPEPEVYEREYQSYYVRGVKTWGPREQDQDTASDFEEDLNYYSPPQLISY